ncbi:transglycosylase family protein [Conexibacter sp. SYSU D00693]|uniref:transglycosylase family protein n=1 Tax=Conexibacter sp. SYSU D00693 TaxID=2812560 RepID=UPI00196A88CD|nr:transglycosylase family protein [Conexibacter sp. SYSU D00693]
MLHRDALARDHEAPQGHRLARRGTWRRAGVAALAGSLAVLALGAPSAVAATPGGVEAGDPEVQAPKPAESRSAETVAAPAVKALKRGSRGTRVRALQRALGIKRVDGVYGRGTVRAVKRFQKRRGLKADGIAGPATLKALGLASTARKVSAPAGDAAAVLAAIAQCESGGDPTAVSPGGKHRGKYQFLRSTWEQMGGQGDPAKAPEPEQDAIAAKLYAEQGAKPWPVCGPKAEAQVGRTAT